MEPEPPDQDVPVELLEPPQGEFPAPPVQTAEQLLPFTVLEWEDFERLCLRVVRLEGEPRRVRPYGVRGQAQGGIDLYASLPSGRYATYQCKRYERFTATDVKRAVDIFLRGRWSRTSEKFVVYIASSGVATALADAIEKQRKRLAKRARPIRFEVWDADELSQTLKEQQQVEVVCDFFGPAWAERFLPPSSGRTEVARMLGELLDRTERRVELITSDWASKQLKLRLEQLAATEPELLAKLYAQIGNPPVAELVRANATSPPQWLVDASSEVWDLLARVTETVGECPPQRRRGRG